jgi:hypothetical protein
MHENLWPIPIHNYSENICLVDSGCGTLHRCSAYYSNLTYSGKEEKRNMLIYLRACGGIQSQNLCEGII